jgi:hypothetical protein
MSIRSSFRALIVTGLVIGLFSAVHADEPTKNRPAPKPLAEKTQKGLAYLANQQNANGGWGQGGGWRTGDAGRVEGADVQDPPDVANTAVAALALIRSGSTPREGVYADHIQKAALFVMDKIEKADDDSPFVTDVRGTQLQSKIGQYVDTFAAALFLSELKGRMPDAESEKRLTAAIDKTMLKIEKNQNADGTFAGNTGWASVLSQALCSKALNRAAQNGVAVKGEVLQRDTRLAAAGVDVAKRDFSTPALAVGGSRIARAAGEPVALSASLPTAGPAAASAPSDAGVSIYAFSAKAGGLQDAVNTALPKLAQAKEVLKDQAATAEARQDAQATLDRARKLEETNAAAVTGIIKRLDDKNFVAGFGNNGGEEFLSYMNISETLLAGSGKEWQSWDKSIGDNLHRVQNEDGSWSGHHCITGRTFCTAAALLTLMADRAPVPVAMKLSQEK